MKKITALVMVVVVAASLFAGCSGKNTKETLYVYNWGEYIDEDLIDEFEKEFGIKVVYDTFSTNEEMYPKVEADPSLYDVICPSEYMVEKMMRNGLLQKIDKSKLSNYGNLNKSLMGVLDAYIDPGNDYMVPYCWGTVGIIYNTNMVEEEPTSWNILWDEKYKGSILMQDSVRDAFMIAQEILGYSVNETDKARLQECADLLKKQKPLVKGYGIDEIRENMIAGDTALGVIYSGEYLYCIDEEEGNPDLAYAVPEEGTNVWYDGWVITSKAKNVDAAHKWIDFLLRGEVAYRNFDYITYPTPNDAAKEFIDEDILNDPAVFPDDEEIAKYEMYKYLGEEVEDQYYELWKTVK